MTKILYLDDEPSLVEFLPMVLQDKGFDTFATMSITEALNKLETEDFDAILLDIMMPPDDDMDAEKLDYGRKTGIEVARRMKALKPDVPIIALTVTTDVKIMNEIRQVKIGHIIHKPTEIDQIIKVLMQVTKK